MFNFGGGDVVVEVGLFVEGEVNKIIDVGEIVGDYVDVLEIRDVLVLS